MNGDRRRSQLIAALGLALLLVGVLTAALFSMREPLSLNDYTAIWGLKAKALFRSGTLESFFRVDPEGTFSHPEYPPLWPIALALASAPAHRWDDLAVTPLWPALVLLASVLAARSARATGPWSLFAGAAVSLLPYWRRYPGYAEGLLVVFVLAAMAATRRFDEEKGAAVRLAIFLTLAAWTKPEGVVAALAAAAVLALARRARAALLVSLSAVLFAALPWALFVSRFAQARPPTDFALASFSIASFAGAVRALASEAAPYAGWAAAAALLLAFSPATRLRRRPVLAWCGLYAAALTGSFAFSRLSPAWHVRWSWDRLAFIPVAVLLPVLAEALAECVRERNVQAPPSASPEEFPLRASAPAP